MCIWTFSHPRDRREEIAQDVSAIKKCKKTSRENKMVEFLKDYKAARFGCKPMKWRV
ncbi:MAG: hypothetical protein ACI92E_000749 [Oceanicoccus sp.]|jgi:hypothetical protein